MTVPSGVRADTLPESEDGLPYRLVAVALGFGHVA
jgi:hypothetical protein